MDDGLSRFCCQNPDCLQHGQRGQGNLTVCGRYGKQQRRLPYCKTCKSRSSERKGTPLFDSRLPDDKALAVLAHLADGCGVRQTSRLVGAGKSTVIRHGLRAGGHARQLHDERVGLPPLDHQGSTGCEGGLRWQEAEEL
jgi:transposase-like protein